MSSSTDKTREMLVNSMVKTKAGTADSDSAKSAAKPAANKKVARKKASSTVAAKSKKVARKPAAKSNPSADPFQSKGRIWPD